jgi:hypothetical protein
MLHAHESSTKFTSLQHLDQEGTMYDLYQEFIRGRLGSSSAMNSQTIEIRFAYQKDEIVRNFTLVIRVSKIYSNFVYSIG